MDEQQHFESRNNLLAYGITIGAIVVLAIVAAVICLSLDTEVNLAKIVAALGFLGAAIASLGPIAGSFRFGTSKPLVDNSTKSEVNK